MRESRVKLRESRFEGGGGGEGGSSSNGGSEAMEFIAGVLQKEKRVKHLMADHFSIIYPFIVIHRYATTKAHLQFRIYDLLLGNIL